MVCSVKDITNSVVAENKNNVAAAVRKAVNMPPTERALLTATPIQLLTRMITQSNPSIDGKKINVIGLKRSGPEQFLVKYKVGNSDKVIELPLRSAAFIKGSKSNLSVDKTTMERFHSDYQYSHNDDDFETLALDITNNPSKIKEVAEYLIEADDYHNDEQHNYVLMKQLGSIQDTLVDMVPNLNVHINNVGEANYGSINVDSGDIHITKGIGGSKGLLEIYVHELFHSITHFAISSVSTGVRKVTARIEKVRSHLLENSTVEDIIKASDNKLTKEKAEALLDHLADPKVGLHEFVALSMTNKAIMTRLKALNMSDKKESQETNLFKRVVEAVTALFSAVAQTVSSEPNKDDLSRMMFLVSKLNEAHKKPLRAKKFSAIRNLISIFEPAEKKFAEYLDGAIEKDRLNKSRNVRRDNEGNVKYWARIMARTFYDDQARDLVGNAFGLMTFKGGMSSVFSPESTIRTILRDASESDLTQDQAEQLGMMSGHIDQKREFLAVQVARTVLSYFATPPTLEQEEMLTSMVLDTDLSAIYETHDMDKLLSSNLEINKAIKDKEVKLLELTDESNVNFYNNQTTLLAEYMVHGTDHIALLMNANNIAKMVGTGKELERVDSKIVDLIDEMATLKALKTSSKKQKLEFREMIKEETDGVRNLVAFQNGQKERAAIDVFPTKSDKLKIIKGYSVQITDPDISVISAPMSQQKELESQGYKLDMELDKHSADDNATQMALYVNNSFMESTFHRVGIRITNRSRRGVTVSESFMKGSDEHKTLKAARAIANLKVRRAKVVNEMFEGSYDVSANSDDTLLTPTLDNLGKPVDFRYGMDKENKIELLNMERKVSLVMGRTASSTYDKKATDSFNKQMMDLIMEDANKNKKNRVSAIGLNNKEYIKIERNSLNKDVAALWRVLPDSITREHNNGFFVRRDLMYTYLGYREMGVDDVLGFDMISNNKAAAVIKYALRFAEKVWQEIVKISKIDIIIRTPGVFIGNVVSNFLLMYVSGYSLKEIVELKLQGVKELNLYVEGFKESLALHAKQDAGIITKEEVRRLNVIENNMLNSPVKDLVDAGFYTTIVEEVEHGEGTGSYFNRAANKKLKNVPKIFRDGLDLLYITENTQIFKLIEKGIQASDFAARYAQYHLMVEAGTSKENAIKTVRDNFIDYNKPNSRFIEWANKNGFIMFTKYFTRIQRVIKAHGVRHPAKLALSIIGQDYLLGDLDEITDQSVLSKDMGNLFYNPFDHFMRVITPSGIEAINAIGDSIDLSSDLKI